MDPHHSRIEIFDNKNLEIICFIRKEKFEDTQWLGLGLGYAV